MAGRDKLVAIAAASLLLAGCAAPSAPPGVATPSATSAPPAASATATRPIRTLPPSSTAPASAPASASPSVLPSAGRPYAAPQIVAAMQASRRPGGVPEQLQTTPIADQIASHIWTYDGAAWPAMAVSGSCGPQACTLDISGTPDGAAGEDLYTFSIVPDDGTVEVLVADLHGYPAELNPELDAVARSGVDPARLAGLELIGARWLPPPADGQFVLSYRSGGEEGSPALDVTVDLATARVLDVERPATN